MYIWQQKLLHYPAFSLKNIISTIWSASRAFSSIIFFRLINLCCKLTNKAILSLYIAAVDTNEQIKIAYYFLQIQFHIKRQVNLVHDSLDQITYPSFCDFEIWSLPSFFGVHIFFVPNTMDNSRLSYQNKVNERHNELIVETY